jgi:8-oxo-dGTP pyrophosphatase MutT (NUDIX family)
VSLHADAHAVLTAWAAPTADQAALQGRYLAHLEAHPDAMTRACFPDHLTAGALVVDATGEHVLLNLHRKAQRWFAFGGHCEPGDTTLAGVALREALEESGLEAVELDPVPAHLDEHAVGFCDPRGEVHHLDVRFVARAPLAARPQTSEESLDVRWWPVTGLPDLEDEMHDLIAIARARWAGRPAQSTDSPGGESTWAAADQPSR